MYYESTLPLPSARSGYIKPTSLPLLTDGFRALSLIHIFSHWDIQIRMGKHSFVICVCFPWNCKFVWEHNVLICICSPWNCIFVWGALFCYMCMFAFELHIRVGSIMFVV